MKIDDHVLIERNDEEFWLRVVQTGKFFESDGLIVGAPGEIINNPNIKLGDMIHFSIGEVVETLTDEDIAETRIR